MELLKQKTEYEQKRDERYLAIYRDYQALEAEGVRTMMILEKLKNKYGVYAHSSIYNAVKRAQLIELEQQLKEKENEKA